MHHLHWTTFFFYFATINKEAVSKALNDSEKLVPWDPNYCNDTKLQESAELTKTALGQFLGYSCDSVFFHCRWGIDGWRTYKKMCRKGLVYDTKGTQNCNYDFNVMGCGMKQCADCFGDQYACCLSEECVDLGKRCDGKYDCILEEDEQNCPTCKQSEFPCVVSEQCIPIDNRCNGIKDCRDGTDEMNCDNCGADYVYCQNTKKCIEKELRCDGKKDCSLGEDEAFCRYETDREYICRDQVHRIALNKVCDEHPDCPDESDEAHCFTDYQEPHAVPVGNIPIDLLLSTSPNASSNNNSIANRVAAAAAAATVKQSAAAAAAAGAGATVKQQQQQQQQQSAGTAAVPRPTTKTITTTTAASVLDRGKTDEDKMGKEEYFYENPESNK